MWEGEYVEDLRILCKAVFGWKFVLILVGSSQITKAPLQFAINPIQIIKRPKHIIFVTISFVIASRTTVISLSITSPQKHKLFTHRYSYQNSSTDSIHALVKFTNTALSLSSSSPLLLWFKIKRRSVGCITSCIAATKYINKRGPPQSRVGHGPHI